MTDTTTTVPAVLALLDGAGIDIAAFTDGLHERLNAMDHDWRRGRVTVTNKARTEAAVALLLDLARAKAFKP